jgi:DNA-binding NarL/FixJ family response regulator
MPLRTGRSALTPRELQVMDLVERGYKNREIGQSLGIRTGTVKIHLKHIFEKTGIRGRYGLALSGLKHKGLLAAVLV